MNKLTKIEVFAKEKFDVDLTPQQLEIIASQATGDPNHGLRWPRGAEITTTANQVAIAYLQDGLGVSDREPDRVYWYRITPGLIDVLLILLDYVHEKNRNAFTWKEVRERLKTFQYTQQTKLRLHGLIAKIKDENDTFTGEWVITSRAAQFLRGDITVPQKVQVRRNTVIGHDDINVSIKEVLGREPYLEGKADFIAPPRPTGPEQARLI